MHTHTEAVESCKAIVDVIKDGLSGSKASPDTYLHTEYAYMRTEFTYTHTYIHTGRLWNLARLL